MDTRKFININLRQIVSVNLAKYCQNARNAARTEMGSVLNNGPHFNAGTRGGLPLSSEEGQPVTPSDWASNFSLNEADSTDLDCTNSKNRMAQAEEGP